MSDVLKHDTVEEHVRLLSYMVTTAYGLKPMAQVKLEINGEAYEENASGDGQFDAFMPVSYTHLSYGMGKAYLWNQLWRPPFLCPRFRVDSPLARKLYVAGHVGVELLCG